MLPTPSSKGVPMSALMPLFRRVLRPTAIAVVLVGVSLNAWAAKGRTLKVDDDPRVGAPDAPLVLIEFGHHL